MADSFDHNWKKYRNWNSMKELFWFQLAAFKVIKVEKFNQKKF